MHAQGLCPVLLTGVAFGAFTLGLQMLIAEDECTHMPRRTLGGAFCGIGTALGAWSFASLILQQSLSYEMALKALDAK